MADKFILRDYRRLVSSIRHSQSFPSDLNKLRKAMELLARAFPEDADRGPYSPFTVGLGAAKTIVTEIDSSLDSVLAALLFPLYGNLTNKELEDTFGESVADVVDSMAMLDDYMNQASDISLEARHIDVNVIKIAKGVKALVVKICEMICMVRNLEFGAKEHDLRRVERLIKTYLPLMDILDLSILKAEIEDEFFKFQSPDLFALEEEKYRDMRSLKVGPFDFRRSIRWLLEERMPTIKYVMFFLPVSAYSLRDYKSDWNIESDSVYYKLRIVLDVDTQQEKELCWKTYAIITERYTPAVERLKDWLSNPRSNGYEALHTTVMVEDALWVEIQICSIRMEQENIDQLLRNFKHTPLWFQSKCKQWKERKYKEFNYFNPIPIIKNENGLTVYTPKLKSMHLESGSTVMDFAYKIHSVFLLTITGAKVNGKVVLPDNKLKDGDVVEVLSGENEMFSPERIKWLNNKKARRFLNQLLRKRRSAVYYYSSISRHLTTYSFGEAEKQYNTILPFLNDDDPIKREFGFLFNKSTGFLFKNWFTGVWRIIGRDLEPEFSYFSVNTRHKEIFFKQPVEKEVSPSSGIKKIDNYLRPEKSGDILEVAVLELFSLFFSIGEAENVFILEELRRQQKGNQFGFDIAFKCSIKNAENLRCLVECKNYSSPPGMAEIAPKLLQADRNSDITHWILISPRADISNDLHNYLNNYETISKFSFDIQIWTPETGVANFFGLLPDLYDIFYTPASGEQHPNDWTDEYRESQHKHFRTLLNRPARIPKSFKSYLNTPDLLLFNTESRDLFNELYEDHVMLKCRYDGGAAVVPLNTTLTKWLSDTESGTVFIILGDFGDGKSGFTYLYSRELIRNFKENAANGWLPIRFSLRLLASGRSFDPRDFVKKRLEEFGASYGDWSELKSKYNLLILLDGFDEMSYEMNTDALMNNIEIILRLLNDEFNGLKVVLTSRKHFFENRHCKELFLERIQAPVIVHICSIERPVAHGYLKRNALRIHQIDKFNVIENSHDPIGLAAKPLYLQMIKKTLKKLSLENFNEVSLYEDYIDQTLSEKIDQLKKDIHVSKVQLITNIKGILEEVAMALQKSTFNYVFLSDFQSGQNNRLVELLWNSLIFDQEDGVSRIAFRSILNMVTIYDETLPGKRWPVAFCHRSMQEYFIARRITSLYINGEYLLLLDLLKSLKLNNEIASFISKIDHKTGNKGDVDLFRQILQNCTHLNDQLLPEEKIIIASNCVRIVSMLSLKLPWQDWTNLLLDHLDFSMADFSHKNFSMSTLRFCNLENVNFEYACFRNTDLTDAILEETMEVVDICVNSSGESLIAYYKDGKLRLWDIKSEKYVSPKIILKNDDPHAKLFKGPDVYVLTDKDRLTYFSIKEEEAFVLSSHTNTSRRQIHDLNKRFFLYEEEDKWGKQCLFLLELSSRGMLSVDEANKDISGYFYRIVSHTDLLRIHGKSGIITLFPVGGATDEIPETAIDPEIKGVIAIDVLRYKRRAGQYLNIALCDSKRYIRIISLKKEGLLWNLLNTYSVRFECKKITCLKWIDDRSIVVGTIDGKIIKYQLDEHSNYQMSRVYSLEIRCKGMKIDNMKGQKEYDFFENKINSQVSGQHPADGD